MPNDKRLTKRQRAVIDGLFAGQISEQQVLDNHNVDRRLYDKWLADETFAGEFDRRVVAARRQSELIIARYATFAAAKLVQLTESENQETARKTCLDIIGLLRPCSADSAQRPADSESQNELPPELASRLLAALAESKPSANTGA
ncbi:MAG: hypothetical protein ABSG82_01575 [Sedimentisphaerales bacterium]|jgi:hypothetical protein